jgi:hypothetical protein
MITFDPAPVICLEPGQSRVLKASVQIRCTLEGSMLTTLRGRTGFEAWEKLLATSLKMGSLEAP